MARSTRSAAAASGAALSRGARLGALAPLLLACGDSAVHVHPGQSIQAALERAAGDPALQAVVVHAGTYRPDAPGQALVWFNARHDGLRVEARGEVTLTAANPELADPADPSYPALVNHVVYFGHGITRRTRFRGFRITGANGYAAPPDAPAIEPAQASLPELAPGLFFFTDGGGIKVFGRSYPTIEAVEVFGNYASPCGGGVSIEHRGFLEGAVLFRDSIFRDNRARFTGSGVDVLYDSAAEFENCLFVGNVSNVPLGRPLRPDEQDFASDYHEAHGSGALTVFRGGRAVVRHSTFTGNWNGVDDRGTGSRYRDSIFWANVAPGGRSQAGRYELDIRDGDAVAGCFIGGEIDDLRGTISASRNTLRAPDPRFDASFRPRAAAYSGAGYRPR